MLNEPEVIAWHDNFLTFRSLSMTMILTSYLMLWYGWLQNGVFSDHPKIFNDFWGMNKKLSPGKVTLSIKTRKIPELKSMQNTVTQVVSCRN